MKDIDRAWTWVSTKLWEYYGPQPKHVYCKGDFVGIAFATFESQLDRDEALKLLKQANTHADGHAVWAKEDQPLQTRTC